MKWLVAIRSWTLIALVIGCMVMLAPVYAKDIKGINNQIGIFVDGLEVDLKLTPPQIDDMGNVLVPLRFISEALSAKVTWHPKEAMVEMKSEAAHILLLQGSRRVYINGNVELIDVPMIYSERYKTFYVPLRFVSTYLNAEVFYQQDVQTRAISISIDRVSLGGLNSSSLPLVNRSQERTTKSNGELFQLLMPNMPEINTPMSSVESEYAYSSRDDVNAFGDAVAVFPMKSHIRYISHRDGKVQGWGVFGGRFSMGEVAAGMSWSQVTSLYPYQTEQRFQIDQSTCTIKQDKAQLGKKLLVLRGMNAFEFYFDQKEDRLMAIKYLPVLNLIKTKSYAASWKYLGTLPNRTIGVLNGDINNKRNNSNSSQIFEMTNLFRQQYQLKALERCALTDQIALSHTKDMISNNFVSHVSPNTGDLKTRFQEMPVKLSFISENLAYGSFDAIEATISWINSPGHRLNLLSSVANKIGIGSYNQFYTQNFVRY